MTEQRQAPTTPDHMLWRSCCHTQTPQWRGIVRGEIGYVCKMCWRMIPEETASRTAESDRRGNR